MKRTDLPYDEKFFSSIEVAVTSSADVIVPLVIDLVDPRSVVDIGCGTGQWLAAFHRHYVEDVTGIDGPWVNKEMLAIPKSCFFERDLTKEFHFERTFDLAVCLEVAEHLEPSFSSGFVASLIKLSKVVLFSAAVPFQGGIHHVNEQWPDFWASLFAEHEYVPIDYVRERVWSHPGVERWYAQNMLLFVEKEHLLSNAKLNEAFNQTRASQLSIVHPKQYLRALSRGPTLKEVLKKFPQLVSNAISYRLKKR